MPHKNCQSCGMPLVSREGHQGGTEVDGTRSTSYCKICYQNGKFTAPDMTLEQMREIVKQKLGEFGIPKFLRGLFTRNLHKLDRWTK
ncbi:zinc ribbon domain-containing protein [Paenibacillus whitsoniae]|uniref:Putative zinc ribbon domain-containing protein n=1 Tax=Paenibacillus whitsoniae TaxID=2496558 RepID=A0A3S0A8W4_9BACL|nr:zinc ribbon domain-containing protein [Paenibacillus whitsoniae]RTE06741.1 hypothetical protein EJQ19_22330 [Paenibacillus whitsoniae]